MAEVANKTDDFIYIASRLCEQFPELDLRFSMQTGNDCFHLTVPELNQNNYEISLVEGADEIIREATFLIKQISQQFDA